MRRLLLSILLVKLGFIAGLAAAAGLVKAWLPSRGDESMDELELLTIFDGLELASRASAFRGGTVLAWFGGVDLDLRNATLAPGAQLDVRAIFGGVNIRVPAGWRVEHDVAAIAGGVSVEVPDPTDPQAPALRVSARAFAGGVAVSADETVPVPAVQPA